MIKSTGALLGFIIALSTIYYISYWGAFDINIFQYLAATDIIKGIAYPLRFGVLLSFLFGIYVLIVTVNGLAAKSKTLSYVKAEKYSERKKNLIANLVVFFLAAILFFYYRDRIWAGAILSIMSLFVVINIKAFVDIVFDATAAGIPKEETLSIKQQILFGLFSLFEVPLLVLLVVNAVISGQVEANAIKSGKVFDYMIVKDLPINIIKTNEKYLIFLGTAGDKYFFIDKASNEHFVVDKAVLQVVKNYHFDKGSKDAQIVFERNIQ